MKEYIKQYIDFLSECKTERECVNYVKKLAEENNFIDIKQAIKENRQLKPGDRVYSVNMNKNIMLMVVGNKPMENGVNIVGSHIDSPRLDLKVTPFYEQKGVCYLDTHYYGGIKKYQWVTRPLALHGVVVKKDGTKIEINIGENENDPVFCISDLLPHLDKTDRSEVTYNGEILDVMVGMDETSNVEIKNEKVKENTLAILKEMGIEEDDFISAEIEVVPAGKAREMGFDKSMILGYGQDDRVCSFAGVKAIIELGIPERTEITILVDKEEIGSQGPTGMNSKYMENQIAELYSLVGGYTELKLRRCLTNSTMLSADVSAGYDPLYPKQSNYPTEAKMNKGISINKYTGSRGKSGANDANPEFIAKIRKILDENKVDYQATEMGRIDQGGGGTIAHFIAEYGMEVLDAGTPVLSMHAPCEITSKKDVYSTYKCYKAYFENLK